MNFQTGEPTCTPPWVGTRRTRSWQEKHVFAGGSGMLWGEETVEHGVGHQPPTVGEA
jgi:hypothetical protein